MRQNAVLTLYMSHRGALVDFASGIVGDRAHGEDVVQEAWLRFDEATRRRFLEEPLGYLYRIVRNLALDGRRRTQRESLVVAGGRFDAVADLSLDDRPTPEAVVLYKDEFDRIVDAIAELPERTRVALEMHRVGGCTLKEIAGALGISLPLAHILVADGVRHCKRRLGRP